MNLAVSVGLRLALLLAERLAARANRIEAGERERIAARLRVIHERLAGERPKD